MPQGFEVLAEALAKQNIEYCFGIVGIPVIEVAYLLQANGVKYYGFRNEQAASYAASMIGYLTQKPGIALGVSGPGMTNLISGMANAMVNKWPMIAIAGAPDASLDGKGSFQEFDQMACAKPVSKYCGRPQSIKDIPGVVEKAVRMSMYGTPGPVYIEMTADVLNAKTDDEIEYPPVVELLSKITMNIGLRPELVSSTISLLKSAKRPLVIVGKGLAYSNAQEEIRTFLKKGNLPFLATPMGKGVVDDLDERSVASARTFVLQNADVIFLCGARLNWILHFGFPPRFNKDVKIIQLENDPHELNQNVKSELVLFGDAKPILGQLNQAVTTPFLSSDHPWWTELKARCQKNQQVSDKLMKDLTVPMNYYAPLKIIEEGLVKTLPKRDYILVAEGSNSMDIGRTILSNAEPKLRLDAGTFGTMGVSFGFAIAAQGLYPDKKVVMVLGDSAFGFSAMELETATRYKMPLKIIIINNNGITGGDEEIDPEGNPIAIPAIHLTPYAKYEKMAEALGGKGVSVNTPKQLQEVLPEMLKDNSLWIVNVFISPSAGRKPQEFSWLTRKEDDKAKL